LFLIPLIVVIQGFGPVVFSSVISLFNNFLANSIARGMFRRVCSETNAIGSSIAALKASDVKPSDSPFFMLMDHLAGNRDLLISLAFKCAGILGVNAISMCLDSVCVWISVSRRIAGPNQSVPFPDIWDILRTAVASAISQDIAMM
jgi:hypothetical protein